VLLFYGFDVQLLHKVGPRRADVGSVAVISSVVNLDADVVVAGLICVAVVELALQKVLA
jgi:hypothetical protein